MWAGRSGVEQKTRRLGGASTENDNCLCRSPATWHTGARMAALLSSMSQVLRQRDFVVLLSCNFVLGLGHSFVLPFISLFGTKEVGMTPLRFGVFMTVTSVVGIAIATYLSRASDLRLSRKTVLVVGGLAGALGHMGYAFVRDFWSLLAIGAGLLGIASVTFGQVFAYARDLLSRSEIERRDVPLYMNVFRLFFALSWTVGPALAALIMRYHSYEGTFVCAAGIFLLFTLGIACFVPRLPPPQATRAAAEAMPLSRALRTPRLPSHFIGFMVFFSCTTMGMMNLPLLIIDTLGGTEAQVGWAFSIAPVFELPLMFYVGVLATRMSHGLLIRAALVIAAVYYLGLSLVESPGYVYPLQILGASIVAVMSGIAITFFQDFLPDQAGTSTNLYVTAQRLGSTAGYLLFGVVLETTGHRGIFTICSLGACVSFLLLFAARERRPAGVVA